VGEAPDEGRGVEVLDDGDAEFWQGGSVFLTARLRASRSRTTQIIATLRLKISHSVEEKADPSLRSG
jgi:hypothetical protein